MECRRSHGSSNVARYRQFFLFEATGDSEDDSTIPVEYCSEANLQNFIWMNILGGFPFVTNSTGTEDDAESCSSDSLDENRDFLDSNDTTTVEAETAVAAAEEEEEEEVMEVKEEVAMAGKVGKESRNSNGMMSRKMMMMMEDEMEADRLFWETCLEAGYP